MAGTLLAAAAALALGMPWWLTAVTVIATAGILASSAAAVRWRKARWHWRLYWRSFRWLQEDIWWLLNLEVADWRRKRRDRRRQRRFNRWLRTGRPLHPPRRARRR